jgi:hypothetical protein
MLTFDECSAALRARPRIAALLLGLVASSLLLAGIEISAHVALHNASTRSAKVEGEYLLEDQDLGYVLRPESRVRAWSRIEGETIYDVHYSIDSQGHRVTLSKGEPPTRTVAFIGCSFVFGEGLEDGETLASAYAALCPQDEVINLGIPGHGPNHLLARLERNELARLPTKASPTIVAYVFIDSHVDRCVGSFFVSMRFGRRAPYWRPDDAGVFRAGDFESGRPLRTFLYRILRKSAALEWIGFDWPPTGAPDSLEVTARVVRACAESFAIRAPEGKFVVIAYPGARFAAAVVAQAGVPPSSFLDYSGLFDPAAPEYSILHDGHPSPKANRTLAKELARDLAVR